MAGMALIGLRLCPLPSKEGNTSAQGEYPHAEGRSVAENIFQRHSQENVVSPNASSIQAKGHFFLNVIRSTQYFRDLPQQV